MARSKNDRINHDSIERLERRAKVKPYKRQSKQHIFDDIDDEDDNSYDYVQNRCLSKTKRKQEEIIYFLLVSYRARSK